MKSFKSSFGPSLGQQADVTNRLFDSVDRMAEALRPAHREAQAPAHHGHRIQEAAQPSHRAAADRSATQRAPADALPFAQEAAYLPEMAYDGVLLEVDLDSGCGHMGLRGTETGRVPILISDPLLRQPGNVYLTALAHMQPLHFLARASVDANGEISRLYVSGLVQPTEAAGELPEADHEAHREAHREAQRVDERQADQPRQASRG